MKNWKRHFEDKRYKLKKKNLRRTPSTNPDLNQCKTSTTKKTKEHINE